MFKKFGKEFREFAMRGNVLDMAVGVMMGGAFGKIVTSLVNDVFMPIISLLTGKIDFNNMFVSLDGTYYETLEAAKTAGVATLNYGAFIAVVIDFIIIAFCIFMVVKMLNKFVKKQETAPPATPKRLCPFCYGELHEEATRCPHCTSQLS